MKYQFEELCNRVVQEINQEKALVESVASYEDKKIRVTERKNGRSVSTGLEPKGCYDWYAATGDFTRAYADIKENPTLLASSANSFSFWYEGETISDSARYRALGNSIALPCAEYVMAGICEVEK